MKTCKICGKAMDDSYNVCPYCGADETAEANSEQTQQNTWQQNPYQQNPYQQNGGYQQNQNPYANNGSYQQYTPPKQNYTPAPRPQRSAYIAAIRAFIGGMFGLHNFYLDNKKTATIQLVVSLVGIALTFGIATIAIEVWAIIDAVKILKGEINTDGTGAMIKMSW